MLELLTFLIENLRRTDEPVSLKRPPIVDTIPTNHRSNAPTSPKRDVVNLDSKLQRLEQLQYALTKQVKCFVFVDQQLSFLSGVRKSQKSASGGE